MKLIVAVIRPETLHAVQAVLDHQSATLLSVSQVLGSGRETGSTELYRGREVRVRPTKLRLEIAANDWSVESAVGAIARAACSGESGLVGDGQVFVLNLQDCVHVCGAERELAAAG